MKILKYVFISLSFLNVYQAYAETPPVGFANNADSKEIMEAWKNKAVVFSLDSAGAQLTGSGGNCFEMNDYKDCEVISFSNEKKLKHKDSKAMCEVMHYVTDQDGYGYKKGEYVLTILAIGVSVAMPFDKPIDPSVGEYKARNNFTVSVKPKGYCSTFVK